MFRAAKLRSLLQANGKQISLLMSLFSPKPLVFGKKYLFLRLICHFSDLMIVIFNQLFVFFAKTLAEWKNVCIFAVANPSNTWEAAKNS